ncbi:MAG: sulfatase-like hydrolase/transferase [Planctomycetes bacterium]|nr:sulfatase-like hydrolase/transferase [Planctomycetota bacterium]
MFVGLVALTVAGPGAAIVAGVDQNVLIIIADDLGVDVLEIYGEGSTFPCTTEIDMLRQEGILFRNAWSDPVGSPTRATIQTGRYGLRTGVTALVTPQEDNGLPLSETIIPEVLDLQENAHLGYSHAAIGKWHLTTPSQGTPPGGYDGPNLSGYQYFAGLVFGHMDFSSYCDWKRTEGVKGELPVSATEFGYATTVNVDDAITWITTQKTNGDPWFLYLAFNAPHKPFHAPLNSLLCEDGVAEDCNPEPALHCPTASDPSCLDLFQDMVEAMDTEIGNLFLEMRNLGVYDDTNIILLSDNGTAGSVTQSPFDPNHGKPTLYEGGVNVPLIISGPRVDSVLENTESGVLVNTTDLYATALEMMGVTAPSGIVLDSVSLVPVLENTTFVPRPFAYAEIEHSMPINSGKTIRNADGYKLIRFGDGTEEFYNLILDEFETRNLLPVDPGSDDEVNYCKLTNHLDHLIASAACEGDVNGDGTVNPFDLGYVVARFGCPVATCDLACDAADADGDGDVDAEDTAYVLARLGTCP